VKSLTEKMSLAPEGVCASSQDGGSEDGSEGGSHVVSKVPSEERAQKSEQGILQGKERERVSQREGISTYFLY